MCVLVRILARKFELMLSLKNIKLDSHHLLITVSPLITVSIGVSTAPPPPLSCQAPPLNQQTVQAPPPLFRQSPPMYWFFKIPL